MDMIDNNEIFQLALQGVIILLVTIVGYMVRQAFTDVKKTIAETARGVQDVQTQVAVFKESHHSLAARVDSLESAQQDLRTKHYDMREKILEIKLNQPRHGG
jgi:uncharacterized protein YoxC